MAEPMVFIQVELSIAARAIELVEALRSGAAPAAWSTASEDVVLCQGVQWSADKVAAVADATTYAGVLALLDTLAAQPGAWIPKGVVERARDIAPVQLRNELGAFSKMLQRLFDSKAWPMEWRKASGSYSYRMAPEIASWWRAARSGAS